MHLTSLLCLLHMLSTSNYLQLPVISNLRYKYSMWIKPTDALNSNFIGITTIHVSGSLSAYHQEFLAVHWLWYILCSCDEPCATRSRMERSSTLVLGCTHYRNWHFFSIFPHPNTCFYKILLHKCCKQVGSHFAFYELIFKDCILNQGLMMT
jgi:hypothetical protein